MWVIFTFFVGQTTKCLTVIRPQAWDPAHRREPVRPEVGGAPLTVTGIQLQLGGANCKLQITNYKFHFILR